MAVTAVNAFSGQPVTDDMYVVAPASGTGLHITPGDYVAWSANYIIAVNTGVASWKASGLGIALDSNPAYDWAGRQVINSAVLVATHGVFRVTANFSGQPLYGVVAAPVTTGSGVVVPAATGATGVDAAWNTGTPVSVSGGTAAAPVAGVAQVIGWYNSGPAGTGQLDIRLWPRTSDYY